MDKGVSLTILLVIFSLGFIKKVELHEENDEIEESDDFQMKSDGPNFPVIVRADYNITDKSQFLATYGRVHFNSTFIRSVEKMVLRERRWDFLINITFTENFIKTLPTGSSWVVVEENVLDVIESDYERNVQRFQKFVFKLNKTSPNILVYVNGRFHKSKVNPLVADYGVRFYNHKGEYKSYELQSLVFLPEGQKRSLSIRVAMVTHHTIYNYYKDLQDDCLKETEISDKAIAKLNYDMLIIAKEMKRMYQSLKLADDELYIDLVKTVVTRTPEELNCLDENRINYNTIDGDAASGFCRSDLMAHENPLNIPKVDFLVVYTRDEIYFRRKIVTGVVFAETMCVVENLVIIYWEDVNSNAVMTAQMLALTMGIEFDRGLSDCDPDNKFLMTENLNKKWNKNSFNFSSCSGPYADRYIERMDRTRGFNCLDKHDGKKPIVQEDPSLPLPGLIHDLNEQCGIIHGPHSLYCGNKNVFKVEVDCKAIRCFDNSSCRSTHKFVLDGTPCANFRMCMKGKCVVDGRAPKVFAIPAFNRRQCERTVTRQTTDIIMYDYYDFKFDAMNDGAEDYDYVDLEDYHDAEDNDGDEANLSIEENRKEVVVHH